jgi:hypothetical protein
MRNASSRSRRRGASRDAQRAIAHLVTRNWRAAIALDHHLDAVRPKADQLDSATDVPSCFLDPRVEPLAMQGGHRQLISMLRASCAQLLRNRFVGGRLLLASLEKPHGLT